MKKMLFVLPILALMFTACKKKPSEEGAATEKVDIYVVGCEKNQANKTVAKLWKNGVAIDLTDGSFNAAANAVAISGTDVYVVGYEINAEGKWIGKLWKNGVVTNIFTGNNFTAAKDIYISGSDVYILGHEFTDTHVYNKLWKNGVYTDVAVQPIPAHVYLRSIFVANGDVYGAGVMTGAAHMWKNGIETNISGGLRSVGSAVFVSDNDVYVAGQKYIDGIFRATLWKNGVPTTLNNDLDYHSLASSVIVSGNDLYVAGRLEGINGSPGPVRLWKNGEEISLSNNFNSSYSSSVSVAVSGNDVYVAAADEDKAKVWKNGTPNELTDGNFVAEVNDIVVVPKP